MRPSLIVRLPNWVGDVIMALPALQAMQNMGIELQLVGKPWAKDLLAGTGLPVIKVEKNVLKTIDNLKRIKTDKVLLLTNSLSSALLSRLAFKAPIGYKDHGRQMFLKRYLTINHETHEVARLWDIARFASSYWFPHMPWPEGIPTKLRLDLSASASDNAKRALDLAGIKQPFWVLCPFAHGTGKNGQSKIWPYWQELSKHLSKDYPLVVCPGKNEESMCASLVPEATVLSGLNLSDYAAVLSHAKRVIANDSGPMHMAAAVGADTLGLFGVSDPQRTSPWGATWLGKPESWPSLLDVIATHQPLNHQIDTKTDSRSNT
jgi:heptosyltransferase-2